MGLGVCPLQAQVTVFAAASTTEVMHDLGTAFAQQGGVQVRFNLASSGSLARQLDAGAPADLYLSANAKWMEYLTEAGIVDAATRTVVARNALVLIVPKGSALSSASFPNQFSGYLAMGDPASVPAGGYAKAALEHRGWHALLQQGVVKGANVRSVLMLIERGEADAGLVYKSDTVHAKGVTVIDTFAPDEHPPIVYPAALLKGASPEATRLLAFMSSPAAQAIWRKHGFMTN